MKSRFRFLLVGLLIAGLPGVLSAYTFFEDNFENAPDAGPNASGPLLGNGMVVGANIFDASNNYLNNYFSFPAPNVTGSGARFCNVATGQSGPDQGLKVLSVFSDYNNGAAHTNGQLVDANVFVEYTLVEADLGTTITFQFDAKYDDVNFFDTTPLTGVPSGSAPAFTPEAGAYVKVIDPGDGFSESISDTEDYSLVTTPDWFTYFLTITIPNDPTWVGRLLQAGFRNKTSQFQDSAVFVDNIFLTSDRVVVEPEPIKIVSLERNEIFDEFIIIFEAEVGCFYELQKWNPVTGVWDFVFSIEAVSTEELLDDVEASEATALFRIIKQDP